MNSVASSPKLMRPERSVMHSARLTKRNGVETRIGPQNTARGRVQSPIVPSAISSFALQKANSPVERVARENEDEDNPLQHQNGRIRQPEPSLQQPAACADAAEQDRDRNNGERILPCQESDEDARKAVACGKVGVGTALHGPHLDHTPKTPKSASQKTNAQ